MLVHGKGKRLTIYIGESDQWRGRPLYMAILEVLRREGAAGATVYRGVAGFGAHSRLHTAALLRLSADLPLIIEVVDSAERIDRLLPLVGPMVQEGLITLEDVEILKYTHRDIPALPRDKRVQDIMTPDPSHVTPETPLAEVVRLLVHQGVKAVPVVDERGRVVGIITGGDLLRRGGLDLRLSLKRHLSVAELHERLRALEREGKQAKDVMTPNPVTVPATASLADTGRLMVEHGVKRVPVVDGEGRLIGIVSRYDVLRTLAADARVGAPLEPPRAAPRTALDIADPNVPTVSPDAPLDLVLHRLLATPYRRVVVVDENGRTVGLITDAAVLAQTTAEERHGILQALARRLHVGEATRPGPGRTAADVMLKDVYTVTAGAPLAEVLQAFVRRGVKRLVVVDEERRPMGIVDRRHLLRVLMQEDEDDVRD